MRETKLLGLYFDGRQDKTKVREELANGKVRTMTSTEEHVVLLALAAGCIPWARFTAHPWC